MSLDPTQQSELYVAKLRGLSRTGLDLELETSRGLANGALGQSRDGQTVVYLVEDEPLRALGRALAAALDAGATTLHLICDQDQGVIARRASNFAIDVHVWTPDAENGLVAVRPDAHVEPASPPQHVLGLAADIAAAGADPVVEHGLLVGEVRGLEIVRAEDHEGTAELRVGVGDFDREAFGLLHGEHPSIDAISEIVSIVSHHRRPGAEMHPLNRVASERWLRSLVMDDPSRIGFDLVTGAEPPVERISVMAPAPAIALGERAGLECVIAFSTGIDLELVPYAADARSKLAPGADLVLVVPRRDDHPITQRLARALSSPAELVTVPDDWRSWQPPAPPESAPR